MERDGLVDQIARAMARAENASEDHFEAYRHVAEAVAAVVEPLLAEKDKDAAVEVVERLLRATMDNPDAGDLHLARHKAREFLAGRAVSGVGSTGFVPSEEADQLASPGSVEEQEPGRLVAACSHCDGHGLMQTGYTGTLQYCGECNACDGSGTVPVVTDEERAALRYACSKCGGVVSFEAVCGSCGDLPARMTDSDAMTDRDEALESRTEWRAVYMDGHREMPFEWKDHEQACRDVAAMRRDGCVAWLEQSLVTRSRPVRVEEQGEAGV